MDEQIARTIGVEGYTYLYPLVLMDVTRRQATNVEAVGQVFGRGPANTFVHVRQFPPADFRDVVRPNFDTLYSVAWLDLHEEPQILSLPDAGDNYYLLPLYDMWGEVFAAPGTRTTGGSARDFAVVGPGWSDDLPAGVRTYHAPTPWVWIVGRTKASVATYDKVHAFQDGMRITPLSAWGGEPPAIKGTIDPTVDDETPPLRQVFAMGADDFFGHAAELLKDNAPHSQDYPMLDRLERIGFEVGKSFDAGVADPVVSDALQSAVSAAQKLISDYQREIGWQKNGWQMMTEEMGNYGTDYLRRAGVELAGLGANLQDDAIYPLTFVDAEGQRLTGKSSYVLHFEKNEIPPVLAFWSLTLYDDEGFQVANSIDRFAIGDRDALVFNDDGSLDIHIRHDPPGSNREEANWLPAPESMFNLCLRLYYPKPEAVRGGWAPPAVKRLD
jgi:hypothetical protein